jgi:hypothetical protein
MCGQRRLGRRCVDRMVGPTSPQAEKSLAVS